MSRWRRFLSWLTPWRRTAALPPARKRGYDGADRGRRMRRWRDKDDGPTAREPDLKKLRERSRDLRRNNPYAARAVNALVSNTIGDGIVARFDRDADQKAWAAWAGSTECDAVGVHTFAGLQALVFGAVVESGECFVLRRKRPSEERLSTPIQLQVLEPDYLDSSKVQAATGAAPRIDNGIEYDERGRAVAYWFYREHPRQRLHDTTISTFESVRYKAEDVIHVLRVDRPGQTRGVPWSSPVITRLRGLDDYEDATVEKAKIAACFAGFIHDPIGDGLPTPDAPAEGEEGEGDEESESDEDYDRIEPGALETLPDGKTITFANPPSTTDYEPFTRTNLRAIAVGFGVPYSTITGDLGGASFSSERIGWLEFDRQISQWRWLMFVPQFLDRVAAWWSEARGIAAGAEAARPTWTAPRRQMISPTEETRAIRERVRAGITSQPEAIREQGYDPDALLAEVVEWNAKLDKHGVAFDTDPRKIGGPSGYVALAAGLEEKPPAPAEEKPA